MNRKTLLAGGLFVGLAALALVLTQKPEKGVRQGDGPRPIESLDASAFDTLAITKDGKTTVISRSEDTYALTEPVAYPADETAAHDAFQAVETLAFASIVTDQASKHRDLEVGDDGLTVEVRKGENSVVSFVVGKSTGNMTLVRLVDKPEVWRVRGSLSYKFDRDATGWRDKVVTKFDDQEANHIEVSANDGSRITLEKGESENDNEASWRVKETTIPVDKLDAETAKGLVNALANLRANAFADDVTLSDAGLDKPRVSVTVTAAGVAHTLHIGAKTDESYYAKTDKDDQIFLIRNFNIERINKRPISFRDKTLCNLSADQIQQISVKKPKASYTLRRGSKDDGDWVLISPKGQLDDSKVAGLTGAFSQWKAAGFAEDTDEGLTGLAKPSVIQAQSKSKGDACTLKVGALSEDAQNYYVSVPGISEVFLVSKWSIERVLKDPKELLKAESP